MRRGESGASPPAVPASDPRITEGIIFKTVGEEMVLLDLQRGVYYGLDAVGARVWELLSQEVAPAEIIERITGEYEVDRATVERDVAALLEQLLEKGLIRLT